MNLNANLFPRAGTPFLRRVTWRHALVGACFLVSAAACGRIAADILTYPHVKTTMDLRIAKESLGVPWVATLAMAAAFLGVVFYQKRRWPAVVGTLLFLSAAVGEIVLWRTLFPDAVILALGLIVHWISPLRATGVIATFDVIAVIVGLPILVQLFGFQKPTRSWTSRVGTDMRSLATAIEAYYVDNNAYPASTLVPAEKMSWDSRSPMPTFRRRGPENVCTLTSPIAYVTSLFPDIFCDLNEHRTFAYWVPPDGKGWIMISPGPDCVFDLKLKDLPRAYDPANRSEPSAILLSEFSYNPTNGTISRGDLWRVRQ